MRAATDERRRARLVLFAFLLTFIASRVLVYLIMARRVPDLYFHLGGTHVHHLNYGIFLLVGVGAYLLFARGAATHLSLVAVLYGIGLGLTFDEFGMWLHLGGGYWQRASFDAVVVVASALGLLGFAPPMAQWKPRDTVGAVTLALAILLFGWLLRESFRYAAREQPRFERLEQDGPR